MGGIILAPRLSTEARQLLFALALVAMGLPVLLEQGRMDVARLQDQHDARQALALHRAAQLLVEEGLSRRRWRQSSLFSRVQQGEWLDVSMLPVEAEGLPGAGVKMKLRDGRACFNVNALAGAHVERARAQLLYLLRMREHTRSGMSPEQMVDRLTDWVDSDDHRRRAGAESGAYLEAGRDYLPAQGMMVDGSEMNVLLPADSRRVRHYPELCTLPDDGPWKLNLNALTAAQLPLLEALYQGEVSSSVLRRLLLQRPESGYANAEEVRRALSGVAEADMRQILGGLVLNSEFYRLETRIRLNGVEYGFQHDLKALGVSQWAARVPAQRIVWLARQRPLF